MLSKAKKFVSLVLVSIFMLGMFSFNVLAATPTISISGGTVIVDNEITVNVTLSSSSNAAGGNFTLQYDSSKVTPVSYTSGTLVSGYTNNCNLSYSSNSIRFTFNGANAITTSGTLVSIKFKAKSTGSASLSFTSGKLYDTNGSSITVTTSGNIITVNNKTTSYTVTYNANGGSVSPSSVNVTSGNSITLPTPTKNYTITYNANNGSGAPSSQSMAITCKGWSASSAATSASYSCGSSYKPTANTTLYAIWDSSISGTVSSTVPTRFGYTFLGWSKSSSATSSSYNPGSNISITGNTTLYAVWKSASTLTTSSSTSVTIGFAYQTVYYKIVPSVTGTYTFESSGSIDSKVTLYSSSGSTIASDDDSGSNQNFKLSSSLTAGTTYYIEFKCYNSKTGSYSVSVTSPTNSPAYVVTYNANGGSVSPSSVNVTSGNSTTLPTPTKNYTITYNANNGSGAPSSQSIAVTCKGWSTSNTTTSASYLCGSSYKPTENTTLYAIWNGSASGKISSINPTRSGYTFQGWSTSSTATTATYSSNSNISVSGNIILYAVWKSNSSTYRITLNANGGSVSPTYFDVKSEESFVLPTPTREGYSCLGWSTDSSASSATFKCGSSYKINQNVTVYAVWKANASIEFLVDEIKLSTQWEAMGIKVFKINAPAGNYSVKYTVGDNSIVSAGFINVNSQNNINGITITPKMAGNTSISIYLYDSKTNLLLATNSFDVSVTDDYYTDVFYTGYRCKNSFAIEGDYVSYDSENTNIYTIDENGNGFSVGTGTTYVEIVDDYGNTQIIKVVVEYDFIDWIIIILLFGWIWY